eukprot:CAMPEP_0203749368 /NCGR_PEP_ID=MMETSP0098-20131031/3962_1 /ASSEMBLY_ACC=CAM_ASM_000208 /TAXON_ID=96639 /ORGANISM=" , Strain NY0313808BC1" /LENGTH=1521 /DNA_ID=CAMNT_0050638417 /DNA_START=894 /DNA_END=5459 /DNA_ORIENTATION=+
MAGNEDGSGGEKQVKMKVYDVRTNVVKRDGINSQIDISASVDSTESGVRVVDRLFRNFVSELESLASIKPGAMGNLEKEEKRVRAAFERYVWSIINEDSVLSELSSRNEEQSSVGGLSNGFDAFPVGDITHTLQNSWSPVNIRYEGVSYTAVGDVNRANGAGTPVATVGSYLWWPLEKCFDGFRCLLQPFVRNDSYTGVAPEVEILKNLNGVIEHKKLTLVLGPPGSGKTSYLRMLSGQLYKEISKNTTITGRVSYNGFMVQALKHLSNWVSYVPQDDHHYTLLTTSETLDFAWECRSLPILKSTYYHEQLVRRIGASATEKVIALEQATVELVLSVLGLDQCADVIIGNALRKGVSGGEKRRVTLGEMLVTGCNILCCDEISTGLDSATTYDIMRFLHCCCRLFDRTIVVALLQPPPETIELFDDIILLADGREIYHGPRTEILQYFQDLGFTCPENKDLGEFLQELPTSSSGDFVTKGFDPSTVPKTSDDFAHAWHNSLLYKSLLSTEDPNERNFISPEQVSENTFWNKFKLALSRNWRIRARNLSSIKVRAFQNVFSGGLFGVLFWQVGDDQWYLKAMLFGLVPQFMQAGSFGNINPLIQDRPIVYKQLRSNFIGVVPKILADYVAFIPMKLLDVLVFGNAIYFMCGLALNVQSYLVFMFCTLLFGQLVEVMMMLTAYSCRLPQTAIIVAIFSVLVMVILSGRVITPDVIPWFFMWIYYINPAAWFNTTLALNEFKSSSKNYDSFPCKVTDAHSNRTISVYERCGDVYLKNRQFPTDESLIIVGVLFLIFINILFLLLTCGALKFWQFERGYAVTEDDNNNEKQVEPLAPGTSSASMIPITRQDSIFVDQKTLVVSGLHYSVKVGKSSVDLLKGIDFVALPGRMCALMGSSGAGKTTLLDVLAGRTTAGKVKGRILVNNEVPDPITFGRMIGYVEQFGVHAEFATVYESLQFSAELRLAQRIGETNADFSTRLFELIEEVIDLLELDMIRDEVSMNLSVEQIKRLTIAVELVGNPPILFADEPTSQLDARAAEIVMRCLHNVAKSGRTVVATIHQPSTSVFSKFDDLLLLKRGGQVVFFDELGENSKNLIDYFESIPGVPKFVPGLNPATWMLEVIGAGTGHSESARAFATQDADEDDSEREIVGFESLYRTSDMFQRNRDKILELLNQWSGRPQVIRKTKSTGRLRNRQRSSSSTLSTPLLGGGTTGEGMKKVQPRTLWTQVKLLLRRNMQLYWRSPNFSLGRIFTLSSVSCVLAFCFYHQKKQTAADIQCIISAIALITNLGGNHNLFNVIPYMVGKRVLFYRETSSGMYSPLAAVLSDGFVEIPYILMQTILSVNITYWGMNFRPDVGTFSMYITTYFVYQLSMTSFGHFLAALSPSVFNAQILANIIVTLFNMVAGVVVPFANLPVFFRPFYYLSLIRMCAETLVTSQTFYDTTIMCSPLGKPLPGTDKCTTDGSLATNITGLQRSVSDYVLKDFLVGYKMSDEWMNLLGLLTWLLALRVATAFATIYINHSKR